MSVLADPPLLLANGEALARVLPESAQGAAVKVLGAATVAVYWGAAAALWHEHPAAQPLRRRLGYRSGREFMLRFPLPDRGRRRRDRREDVLGVAALATYPLWLWLGWDHGRRARPRAG
jgi:hypothetical protein